jgi:hypothetical protein
MSAHRLGELLELTVLEDLPARVESVQDGYLVTTPTVGLLMPVGGRATCGVAENWLGSG